MRIAVISDIHGNLPALTTVLKDIDSRNINLIICLGDLVDFAPWSNEVIELICSLNISTIMGNHDERIALDLPIVPLTKHSLEETQARIKAINHTKAIITNENKKYLTSLPKQIIIEYNNIRLFFTHASPVSIDEYLYENDDFLLKERMETLDAETLVIGHTHLSYIREISGKKIINIGSVGRSKEPGNKACYGVLEITNDQLFCEIIKIDYPIQQTVSAIITSDIPDFYARFLQNNL